MIDLEAIETECERAKRMTWGVYSVHRYLWDITALIAEVRKLRAQLFDAGLPDANDFPEVPNKWGGL